MSDITFVKGYGFPRGSAMDYAGYAGGGPTAGDLNYGPIRFEGYPTRTPVSIRSLPDASVFAPIPALDGIFGGEEGGYGRARYGAAISLGPLTLDPTPGYYGPPGISSADGLVHYADGSTCDPSSGSCPGVPNANAGGALWGLAALAVGLALFMKR